MGECVALTMKSRVILLVSGICLVCFGSVVPWHFSFIRVSLNLCAIALLVRCLKESLLWAKESQLSAMRWQAELAREEDYLQASLISTQAYLQPDTGRAGMGNSLPQSDEPNYSADNFSGNYHLFDWQQFRLNPTAYPHIRIIGKTGAGKSTLGKYVASLFPGQVEVITIKGSKTWEGLPVTGLGFDYDAIASRMKDVLEDMYNRYQQIDGGGLSPGDLEPYTLIIDEWSTIVLKYPQGKELIRELICLAREAQIRLVCLSHGEQVSLWGLEGMSSLKECFTDIRIGNFAVDYLWTLKRSLSTDVFNSIYAELERQGSRCCLVDRVPARIPQLR